MLRRIRSRLSYANVVATMALFIALGGVSYAAVKLPANSVGTKQLKAGAVTGAKVKDKSLTAADFKGSVQGPTGPQGVAGKDATAAALTDGSVGGAKLGAITVRTSSTTFLDIDTGSSAEVSCLPSERLISGGVDGPNSTGNFGWSVYSSQPLITDGVATGWKARAYNKTTSNHEGFAAYALCLAG